MEKLTLVTSSSIARRFSIGFSWNLLGRLASSAVGLLVSIAIARGLGPLDYGIYASVITVATLVPYLVSLGLESVILVHVPQLSPETGKPGQRVFLLQMVSLTRLLVSLFATLALYVLASPLASALNQPGMAFYLQIASPMMFFSGLGTTIRAIFSAVLDLKWVTIAEVMLQGMGLLLVWQVISRGYGLAGVLAVLVLTAFLNLLAYAVLSRAHFSGTAQRLSLSPIYRFGVVAWGVSLIAMALDKQIDIVFLNVFAVPSSQVGFYNLAYSLSIQLYVLAMGMGPLVQATLAEGYAKTGQEGLRRGWTLFTKFDGALELPVFIFAIFYGQQLIYALYGAEYEPAFSIFYPFALVRLLILISGTSFCAPVFYVIHKERTSLLLRMAAAFANVVLDVTLIPLWGVMGAVAATSAATLAAYMLELVFLWRYVRPSFPFVFQGKLVLALLLALLPTLLVGGDGLPSLLGKAGVYAAAYVLVLFLIKPLGDEEKNLIKGIDQRLYPIVKRF